MDRKKEFIGTCINNPFSTRSKFEKVMDNAVLISKAKFLKNCDVVEEIKDNIKRFPNDFGFYQSGEVYFFTWSSIEHFFK